MLIKALENHAAEKGNHKCLIISKDMKKIIN